MSFYQQLVAFFLWLFYVVGFAAEFLVRLASIGVIMVLSVVGYVVGIVECGFLNGRQIAHDLVATANDEADTGH